MPDASTPARDAKLVQYLSEAFANEKRLETALEAHIALTTRASYKKRLREHLTETKRHAREVERRVKQLGGRADVVQSLPSALTDFAGALVSGAHKATALAQGPLHALRGTGDEERQLKNAKTEYAEEAQEIGTYSAIQTLAEAVGDRETATLARSILRDEQRMFKFLEKEIARLSTAVAKAEIPAAQRNGGTRRRSSSRRAASGGRRSTARRSTSTRAPARSTRASSGTRGSRTTAGSTRARARG